MKCKILIFDRKLHRVQATGSMDTFRLNSSSERNQCVWGKVGGRCPPRQKKIIVAP